MKRSRFRSALLVLAAFAVGVALATSAAHALTLPVSEDTSTTTSVKLAKSAGKATTLPVTATRSALVRFEVSAFNGAVAAADVTSARLVLYIGTAKKPGDLTLHAVTSQWSEVFVAPLVVPTIDAGNLATIAAANVVAKQFVIVDVTAQVKAWLTTPANDFGFAISTTSTTNVTLGAKEGSGTGYPATLEIDTGVAGVASIDGSVIANGSVGSDQLGSNLVLGGVTTGTFKGDGAAITNLNAGSLTGGVAFGLTDRPAVVGTVGGATTVASAVSGDYAYLANGSGGVQIVDISDPAAPVVLSTVPESSMGNGTALGVTVRATTLYVANGADGLRGIDISNPLSPTPNLHFPQSALGNGTANAVLAGGDFIFVANGSGGLVVFYTDGPSFTPSPIFPESQLGNGTAMGVFYDETTRSLCLANGADGLRIFNNPGGATVTLVGHVSQANLQAAGTALGVAVRGTTAYLANDAGGLAVIDVTNRAAPVAGASLNLGGNARGVAISGTSLYLANGSDGLRAFDLSDPLAPAARGSAAQSALGNGDAVGLAADGSYAFVANSTAGLQIVSTQTMSAQVFSAGKFFGDGAGLTLDGAPLASVFVNKTGDTMSGSLSSTSGQLVWRPTGEQAKLVLNAASMANTLASRVDFAQRGVTKWSMLNDFDQTASDELSIVYNPTGPTRTMSLMPNGNVGIGRQPTTNTLEVEGEASKTTATAWLANSDRRIKLDIRPVEHALETIERVRPVVFRYTEEYRRAHPSVEDRDYWNVIAQEFREVFPSAVRGSGERLADGSEILQVDTYPATITALAAIKELNARLREKDAEIGGLQKETEELKARLERLEQMVTK